MTVKDVFDFLNSRFPTESACDFDNVGLLIGNPGQTVNKAIVSLDCTIHTITEAAKNNCELIITHHPVIFDPLKNIISGTVPYEAIKNNVSVISMHTNLDIGTGGVNDSLCDVVFDSKPETVTALDGYKLKKCRIFPVLPKDFAKHLKAKLNGRVKFNNTNKPITNVLVCSGSGGGYIAEAESLGCDAFLTADVKHNQFLEAEHLGIALFDAGHFNTEDVVVEPLKELLQTEFPKIGFLSTHHSTIEYL